MNPTLAQFAELQKTYVDALSALSNTLVNATEQVASLNAAASKALLEDATATGRSVLDAKDPGAAMAITSAMAQPAAKRIMGYSRNAFGIATGVGVQMYQLIESQVAEGRRRVAEMIEASIKDAPPGSEAAVMFLRTALSASNTAYDAVHTATKQASGLVESNMAAAATAAEGVDRSFTTQPAKAEVS